MNTIRVAFTYSLVFALCFASSVPAQQGKKKAGAAKAIPLAETIPEDSTTKHAVQVNGKTIEYTAKAGQMPIKNAQGEIEAHIFYTAYTLDKKGGAAALDFRLQRRPRVGFHLGAHGRHGAAHRQAARRRRHAAAALPACR